MGRDKKITIFSYFSVSEPKSLLKSGILSRDSTTFGRPEESALMKGGCPSADMFYLLIKLDWDFAGQIALKMLLLQERSTTSPPLLKTPS